jgi:hypothetical protein
VNSVSRFTKSRKLSNLTFHYNKRSIRGIRLRKLSRKSHASDHFNWRNATLVSAAPRPTDWNDCLSEANDPMETKGWIGLRLAAAARVSEE